MIQDNDFIVYKITNTINGKIYFGVTKCTLSIRWNSHRHAALRKKKFTFLANAMSKYGVDNFKIEMVKSCENEAEMYELEKELILSFNSNNRKIGYNNSTGGEISSKGMKHTEATKRHLSQIQKGKKRKPHSKETIERMRKTSKGRDMTKQVAISANKRRGKKLPIQHIKNVSSALKGVGNIPVIKKNIQGVVICEYESVSIAAKLTGILQSAISNTLTNRAKTSGGFIWEYK